MRFFFILLFFFTLVFFSIVGHLTQIYNLIDYIINIDYDIFRPGNLENWEASLKLFDKMLRIIERDAKNLIDKCIPTLRSTEKGIELINSLAQLNTRKCLVTHMLTKHDSIVQKFISEIETIEQEFRVCVLKIEKKTTRIRFDTLFIRQ